MTSFFKFSTCFVKLVTSKHYFVVFIKNESKRKKGFISKAESHCKSCRYAAKYNIGICIYRFPTDMKRKYDLLLSWFVFVCIYKSWFWGKQNEGTPLLIEFSSAKQEEVTGKCIKLLRHGKGDEATERGRGKENMRETQGNVCFIKGMTSSRKRSTSAAITATATGPVIAFICERKEETIKEIIHYTELLISMLICCVFVHVLKERQRDGMKE